MSTEHVDVLIIGAGLSGIGAACQLRERQPGRTVAVLESREVSGGTWDLFRYPGIRSDSDMYTFGYHWRPWRNERALADGDAILDYLRQVASEYGVDRLIRYRHRVVGASWDSEAARWTVRAETPDGEITLTASFLWNCGGYYDYDEGYTPEFPGLDDYQGQVIHPQHWPEDLDYAGKKVVVIGSGATAVTLVPAMVAGGAGHVTMLQRSPTYVMSIPGRDPLAARLARLPEKVRFPVLRWKNILVSVGLYQFSRKRPDALRSFIRKNTLKMLPPEIDVDVHFKPTYDPWDQRLCLVPDGDLFRAFRKGQATVVTDTIETFTEKGIRLTSGEELEADIIVTATGLKLLALNAPMEVDGRPVKLPETMAYKAMMLSGIPNFAFTIGYTNASWTLKADLVSDYVCRLLDHLDRNGLRVATPRPDPTVGERPLMDFSAGYVLRALDELPKQGDRSPWQLKQNYLTDVRKIRRDDIDDGVLTFA
ncbi:NAD(P)/FAD-dependent oxidoreductase [Nocardioides hankookensis]|uniref:Flavin-containing monooxygenase n=1 Tax=Nocardioides hankookensis TaxID=443157 RepID=A0ABW1LC69_9ACTN